MSDTVPDQLDMPTDLYKIWKHNQDGHTVCLLYFVTDAERNLPMIIYRQVEVSEFGRVLPSSVKHPIYAMATRLFVKTYSEVQFDNAWPY